MVAMAISVVTAVLVFDVPFRGSVVALLVVSVGVPGRDAAAWDC